MNKNKKALQSVHAFRLMIFQPKGDIETCNVIKNRDSDTSVFLWILQNFQEHLFYRTSQDDCFWWPTDESDDHFLKPCLNSEWKKSICIVKMQEGQFL